jgi:hypothetical protein
LHLLPANRHFFIRFLLLFSIEQYRSKVLCAVQCGATAVFRRRDLPRGTQVASALIRAVA